MSRNVTTFYGGDPERQDRGGEVQSIGEVLEELLAQYQLRFPNINVVLVETAATTAV